MATGNSQIKPLQKYTKGSDGSTVIPASKRPDGTWRKPIRVKDGFVPQEEVPVYKTRPEIAKETAPSGPFGLDPADAEVQTKGLSKNAKKRAKQKEKKAKEAGEVDETADKLQSLNITSKKS